MNEGPVATLIIALELVAGGAWDIFQVPYVHELVVEKLGYPAYFLVIIGVWKVPGALALVIPRHPRLTGWAYAGAFFTYSGAVASTRLRHHRIRVLAAVTVGAERRSAVTAWPPESSASEISLSSSTAVC